MEARSSTDARIGRFVLWSALAIYFIAWAATATAGFTRMLVAGVLLATAYVGAHAFEIRRRGRCFLSADATAAPVAFAVAAVIAVVAYEGAADRIAFAIRVAMAFVAGHVAALAYAFVIGKVLEGVFRERIGRERAAGRSAQPDTGRASEPSGD